MVSQRWLVLALASGSFAALNGVFAKLTTTQLTANISRAISHFLSLSASTDMVAEYIVRALFFGLNILSNIVMWTLFTRALTAASSATRVTITNTTANFLVTALLGMMVFQERVAPLWWFGAILMAAGCILVGLREEENKTKLSDAGSFAENDSQGEVERGRSVDETDLIALDNEEVKLTKGGAASSAMAV